MEHWVQAYAIIQGTDYRLDTKLNPLAAAQILASRYGFYDVDLKDNDEGRYTIVATGEKRTLTVKGRTLTEAVDKLCRILIGE